MDSNEFFNPDGDEFEEEETPGHSPLSDPGQMYHTLAAMLKELEEGGELTPKMCGFIHAADETARMIAIPHLPAITSIVHIRKQLDFMYGMLTILTRLIRDKLDVSDMELVKMQHMAEARGTMAILEILADNMEEDGPKVYMSIKHRKRDEEEDGGEDEGYHGPDLGFLRY